MVSDKIWRYLTISFDLLEAFSKTGRMDVKRERDREREEEGDDESNLSQWNGHRIN